MTRFDRVALLASVAVAAWLRLPGIDVRGTFDADQGHDMLTLLAFTRDGVVPLLGPKTSVGEFHHGAFYYYLLAPSAAVSGSDPVVVTAFLALLGIGAVAITWWLGRAIGGSMSGAIAGLLFAASPAAIEQSTFIWNPNPIAFFAALALAAAWRAKSAGHGAWWAVSLGAAGVVVQLHVLGAVFLLGILAIVALEARRDRAVIRPLIAGVAAVALLFVPLLVHELQSGFLETRGVLDYLRGADGSEAGNPIATLLIAAVRVVGWPLLGLVTEVLAPAAVLLAVTIAAAAVGLRAVPAPRRTAFRWLVGLLAWSTVALSVAAPSLLRVVLRLPNDHYHAFLDPIVVLVLAVPAGILFERGLEAWRSTRRPVVGLATAAIGLAVVVLFTAELIRRPAEVDADGGWPAMRDAGAQVVSIANGRPIALYGLPTFKLPDAVGFPIVHAGGTLQAEPWAIPGNVALVVACDRLFEAAIGAPCGGPAEDAFVVQKLGGTLGNPPVPPPVQRIEASPRTWISVYVQ